VINGTQLRTLGSNRFVGDSPRCREDPVEDDAHVSWAREVHDAIAPYATEGVAVNFLSQKGQERVRVAYGDNYDRLVELKNTWDPENLFRMNQNIEPTV
jgi:FAD/FMN-containing dehydrogenase